MTQDKELELMRQQFFEGQVATSATMNSYSSDTPPDADPALYSAGFPTSR